MMSAETVLETLAVMKTLTWWESREEFTHIIRRESIKSYFTIGD